MQGRNRSGRKFDFRQGLDQDSKEDIEYNTEDNEKQKSDDEIILEHHGSKFIKSKSY